MFCQLRNSVKVVTIKPCRRKACLCFANFEKQSAKPKDNRIERREYEKYQQCYMSRRTFLL